MEICTASRMDTLQASALVVNNYEKKRYFASEEAKYLKAQELLDMDMNHRTHGSGFTLVAKENGVVVGTVMLEFDPSELSIDTLFPKEMTELRTSGKSFVYFGAFAISPEYSCTRTSMRMLKEQWRLLKDRGTEIGICVVNPSHVGLYERFGFKVLATKANMTGLSQAPAVLLGIKSNEVKL